jgi:proteasome accessory factor C
MSGAQGQVARLLTLVPFLHNHGQIRLADAADLLDTTPSQVLSDLKVLFMCGLPGGMPDDLIDVDLEAIEADDGLPRSDGMIRVSNADYLARPLRLTPIEASAMIVSLRVLRESAPPATVAIVDAVLAKLQEAAADAAATHQVEVADDDRSSALAELAARLQRAAADGRQVRLDYFVPARDQVSQRVVDPRGVVSRRGASYLDAWCHRAEGPRLFRLDRIASAEVLESAITTERTAPRELTDGPLLEDGPSDETTLVTLRLAPEATWMTEYYAVQEVRRRDDGGADVDLLVADPRWLTRLLLRLAPYATVVRPAEFTESLSTAARTALALYDEGVD